MATPFFPWMGGKRRLASKILPHFSEHTCYVEAFAGAGALLFAKEPSKVEVLNDLDGEVVNLYRVVQHHLEEFCRQFKWAMHSRTMFEWARAAAPVTLTDIQRAARFYYLLKCGFGARVRSPSFGTSATAAPKLNLLRMEEELSAAHLRLSRVVVENLPWAEVVARYDRPATLFYFDPPYLGTAGYAERFPESEYENLAEVMRGLQGRAVLSLNDCPRVREIFAGLPCDRLDVKYRVGKANDTARGELVIRSR